MRQALLAVSFGTSVEEARALDLAGVERALAQVLDSLWPAVPGTAAVLVGHGSGHPGSMAYPALQGVLELMGRSDLVVGTVEGRPDQAAVLKRLEALEVERVILLPLLLAAGVHAREDIAGPQPDSWISTLKAAGFQTWARLEGMGRLPQIQALYQAGLERLREGAADRAL